jgi:regulator of protease activity HflC (stomatin/prohibitin superfamily)
LLIFQVVQAMQAQVTAEREKRASILTSEAVRQSAINIAQGKKQSTILASEATRAENINNAEGEARAILLRANATSQGLRMVANGGQQAVAMDVAEKYVEAFGKLAKEGNAIVVPAALGDMGAMIAQVRTLSTSPC